MKTVVIQSPTRIHISLADMGHATARTYGGIGFSIDTPCILWQIEHARKFTFHGLESLDCRAKSELMALSQKLRAQQNTPEFSASLLSCPPQHVGFGTKTALMLGFSVALNRFAEGRLTQF
jgi:beta-ribofuranosylaminobenzene 5'-phosphate synthase